jgi:hypothetical protein
MLYNSVIFYNVMYIVPLYSGACATRNLAIVDRRNFRLSVRRMPPTGGQADMYWKVGQQC